MTRSVLAQVRVELALTLRRGESLLVALVIPVGILAFFSKADFVDLGVETPVEFLTPGVLALAVMSSAMVSLAIATGFERRYGVLKRLGASPLTRGRLLAAKITSVLAIEALQIVVLVVTAVALDWRPDAAGIVPALGLVVAGTVAFASLGLLMAGTLRAEATLALANGLYLVFTAIGGMAYPLEQMPRAVELVAQALPGAALSESLRGVLTDGADVPSWSLIVLAAWTIATPVVTSRLFRWEER